MSETSNKKKEEQKMSNEELKKRLAANLEELRFQSRLIFSLIFLVILIHFSMKDNGEINTDVTKETCTKDNIFELLDFLNDVQLERLWVRDLLVIFNSTIMDMTMFSLLYLFYVGVLKGTSGFLGLMCCSLSKAFI